MRKKSCFISLFYLISTIYGTGSLAQSKREYTESQLSFQVGFSVKGVVEFSCTKKTQKPIFRLCTDFGLGSNVLSRDIYFAINTELQLYNGGLGSRRRRGDNKPAISLDIISSFTLTTGLHNYLTSDSLTEILKSNRNQPLYYFSNFAIPALQNPYNYSISAGTNFVFSTDKYKAPQRVGFFNLHIKSVQFSYYNDGGTPFDQTYLGDGKDRFYTGGGLFSFHGKSSMDVNLVELAFHKFTGYTQNAFEVSNRLDLAFVNYNNKEQKYYNKSLWSLTVSNPEKGFGVNINRYNLTNWDIQHLIHWSIFNSYHLVPYDSYFSVSGIYYYNYTNIGLR